MCRSTWLLSCGTVVLSALFFLAAGCAPVQYRTESGRVLILEPDRSDQTGKVEPSAAIRCQEGNTAVYKKLFGEQHNPCAELGVFLINNMVIDEGITQFEKGIAAAPSYNATQSSLKTVNMGIIQKTRFANILFDLCLNKQVKDLHDGSDITGEICAQAGALFEKVKYRENALLMYRKQCELTGRCDEFNRLASPPKL